MAAKGANDPCSNFLRPSGGYHRCGSGAPKEEVRATRTYVHTSQKDMDPELGSVANAPKIVFVSEPGITDLLLLTDAAQGDSFGSQEGLVHPHKRARCCTASAQT